MIVKPKVRGYICTTAHFEGCKALIQQQINYVKSQPKPVNAPKKVLVLGASMGYGLASRIVAAYSCGASTLGVIFDKQADGNRTATSGWYNTASFEQIAAADGYYAKTINGDAYSDAVKEQVIETIKRDLGKVDMVVYSLAAPRRMDKDGTLYTSVLKTVGESFTNKSIDLKTNTVSEVTVEPATEEEIFSTVKVMGGEDWKEWISALKKANAIEDNAVTVAYSYIGPSITHPMYFDGTIGKAKEHLLNTSKEIINELGINAYISVNKALVTQSSSAIPIVPLYISILYKVMKEKGSHEGCIEQMYRLFAQKLFNGDKVLVDENNQIRLDDLEMQPDIQNKVLELWNIISSENIYECSDIEGYKKDFYNLFGFEVDGIDYDKDIDVNVSINSINNI